MAVFDRNRPLTTKNHQPPRNPSYRKDEDKSKLVCSHCGGKKHTKETCFYIHGFLEWWEEMKKARQARNTGRNHGGGRAAAAVAIDCATYTEKSVGGSGESQPEEKPTIASVSVARTWSEGTVLSARIIPGGGSGGEGTTEIARVPTGAKELAAARVSQIKPIYTPNFPESQPTPQKTQNSKPDPDPKLPPN